MKRFFDFFPPPAFLEMSAAGIDIGEEAVRSIEFVRRASGLQLKAFHSEFLPANSIKNAEIVDVPKITEALKRVRETLGFEFAHIALPEEKAYIFRTAVELAEPGHLRDSIEFLLEENVPLAVSEAVFDFTILESAHRDTNHTDVVVVVLPRHYIKTVTEIIKNAGIFPLSLQIAPSAIARAFISPGLSGTSLIVQFYSEKTVVIIVSQGAVQFTSTVGIGSNTFTSSIEKHFNINREEALAVKRGGRRLSNKEKVKLFSSLVNSISALKDELHRLIIYWHTFKGRGDEVGERIESVILSGEDALLPGLGEYLATTLGISVEVGNVWRQAFSFDDYIPPLGVSDSLNYAAAAGLALTNKF